MWLTVWNAQREIWRYAFFNITALTFEFFIHTLQTVSRTVSNASTLLNTWTRILSQTEHNQRLILNPTWHGASQDISDMENESVMRRQQKERREAEEAQREEVSARKAEEDERRREEVADGRGSRRIRGRGRGVGKRQTGGYVGVGGQSSGRGVARGMARGTKRGGGTRPAMADTGIGRGLSERGRGRGLS